VREEIQGEARRGKAQRFIEKKVSILNLSGNEVYHTA
jgi:hypothetical protein